MRRDWLESLIRKAKSEGVYAEQVDPRGLADLIMAIFDGLRLGRLLWKDDFDVDGALQSLLLMQTGRLTNGANVTVGKKEARSAGGARAR